MSSAAAVVHHAAPSSTPAGVELPPSSPPTSPDASPLEPHASELPSSSPRPGARGWRSGNPRRSSSPPRDDGDPSQLPRYIQACQAGAWSLKMHSKSDPRKRWALPYRCRSWRHEGECRTWRAHENFTRLLGGLDRFRVEDVLFLVLTFDRTELEHAGVSRYECFRALWRHWQSLRQAIVREVRRTDPTAKVPYALTVEVHRSGWPHVNVILVSPVLAKRLRAHDYCTRALERDAKGRVIRSSHQADLCEHPECPRNWLAAHAEACGFGRVLSLEHARSSSAVAGYVTKLAGELELAGSGPPRVAGELLKLSQVPENAPVRFRRLRSSRRFLEPPHKNPDLAGALVFGHYELVNLAVQLGIDLGGDAVDAGELERAREAGQRYRAPPWVRDRVTLRLLELEAGRLWGPAAASYARRLARELAALDPSDGR